MATLDPSNIVNGNTIQASDIEQLYSAFGTGSSNITGLEMTGSLYGNALTATTATTATTASNITTAIVTTGTYYLTFVTGSGTKAPKIASLLEYDPSTNELTVSASYAESSSYAANAWDGLYSYQTPPSTYILDSISPNFLTLDTLNSGPYSITVSPGVDGQLVEFITGPAVQDMDLTQIEITGSGCRLFGFNGNFVPDGNDDLLNNVVNINNANSIRFLYQGTDWYSIL